MNWTLRTKPDPVLKQKCELVESISSWHRNLAEAMVRTAQEKGGIGIAAPQLGELVRIICIRWGEEWITLVNPTILRMSPQVFGSLEKCLSLPEGAVYRIQRPKITRVMGSDLEGDMGAIKGRDILSAALCHEIDHLSGVLIDEKGPLATF